MCIGKSSTAELKKARDDHRKSIGGARLPSRCDAFLIQGVMGATLVLS